MTVKHGNINTSRDMEWIAQWDDYDGAPDACPTQSVIGTGNTETSAIRELIDATREFDEADQRIAEYLQYLVDKAEAKIENYHNARREDVVMEAHNDKT